MRKEHIIFTRTLNKNAISSTKHDLKINNGVKRNHQNDVSFSWVNYEGWGKIYVKKKFQQ